MKTINITNKVVLVLTMHKAGSSTLMQAVREAGRNPERGYGENINEIHDVDYYEAVITPVRDPVARNISFFFEVQGETIEYRNYPVTTIYTFFMKISTGLVPYLLEALHGH